MPRQKTMPEGQRVFAYLEGDRLGVWVGTVERGRKTNKYKVWVHQLTEDGFMWILRYLDPELVDVDSTWDPKAPTPTPVNGNGAVSPAADLESADGCPLCDPSLPPGVYGLCKEHSDKCIAQQIDEFTDALEGW